MQKRSIEDMQELSYYRESRDGILHLCTLGGRDFGRRIMFDSNRVCRRFFCDRNASMAQNSGVRKD